MNRVCGFPNMFEAALDGEFKALYVEGEDIAQSDPNTHHVTAAMSAMECIIVQDLVLNETANSPTYSSRDPRSSRRTYLHQRRTAYFPRAQGDEVEVRLRRLGDHPAVFERPGLPDELPASRPKSWMRSRA